MGPAPLAAAGGGEAAILHILYRVYKFLCLNSGVHHRLWVQHRSRQLEEVGLIFANLTQLKSGSLIVYGGQKCTLVQAGAQQGAGGNLIVNGASTSRDNWRRRGCNFGLHS